MFNRRKPEEEWRGWCQCHAPAYNPCPLCGKPVSSRPPTLARADYPTSSTCRQCEQHFTFSKRRRAPMYCSGKCRKAGKLAALRSSGRPYIGPGGYRYVLSEGEWRSEHVVIMERSLGRSLTADEHITHLNGVRSDNSLTNLSLTHNPAHSLLNERSQRRSVLTRGGARREK